MTSVDGGEDVGRAVSVGVEVGGDVGLAVAVGVGEDVYYTTKRHGIRKCGQATFRLVTLKERNFHGRVKLFIFATNTSL